MKRALDLEETRRSFLHVCAGIIASEQQLSEADRAIGDGDHGTGMARGFAAVQAKLEGGKFTGQKQIFQAIGQALLMTVGGASGAIFGTWFLGGSKNFAEGQVFDAALLAQWLGDGLAAIQQRGKAQVGDKTMVDALAPAAKAAAQYKDRDIETALVEVEKAAETGMESTKNLVAKVGRAKTLGERAVGHSDPGAITTYLILKVLADGLSGERIQRG